MSQVSQVNLHKLTYRAEIDGLRAFAVLAVVLFHAFPTWLRGGFIGVDIFFVISGFLITRHIFENLDNESFSFIDFFGRRIRRIFPALTLIMISSLAFGWFILLEGEYTQLGKHIASGAGFIVNFILVDESGYFDGAAETKPMLHLWSLAVEEQFYIVWPLVLWLAWKRRLNLLTIIVFFALASFFVNLRFVESHPVESFFWPFGRFWELLSGSILAWLSLYKREYLDKTKIRIDRYLIRIIHSKDMLADGSTTANVMSFSGLFLLAYGVANIHEELAFPSTWAIIPIFGALLVISAGSKAWLNRVFLMNPIAVWFGLISYPLYLWHWPILSFWQIVEGEMPHRDARILAVLVSVLLAWLTYLFIEKPIRRSGGWRKKTISLCLLLMLTFVFSFFVYKTDARILPLSPKQQVADTAKASPKRNECHYAQNEDYKTRKPCKYFGSKYSVAVFGNSHGVELAYGLAQELRNDNVGIVHHTMSGCVHNYKMDRQKEGRLICEQWQEKVVKEIASDKKIKTVVVSYRNELDLQKNAERHSLIKMLSELAKANKDVILVLQAPMPKMHINNYIRKYVYSTNEDVKGRSLEEWNTLYHAKTNLVAELPSNVMIYDPVDAFCDNRECYVIENGKALFFDDDHMSIYGARMVAKEVVKLFKK